MDYFGIALIIVVVVGSVHFVYQYGIKAGSEIGRREILEENIKRASVQIKEYDNEMDSLIDDLVQER